MNHAHRRLDALPLTRGNVSGKAAAVNGTVLARFVAEVRRQPAFDFGDRHAGSLGVGFDLVARDAVDGEVAAFGMGEIKTADARGRVHREMLGQMDARRRLGFEQIEKDSLFGVIGTGRIAGGGADAAIFFRDQIVGRKMLLAAVAPIGRAC